MPPEYAARRLRPGIGQVVQAERLKQRTTGLFYGDVLTPTIPGAHWEVVQEGYPLVRVTRTVAVDVVRVAIRRLAVADPTLAQNYAHVLEIVGRQA